MEAACLDKLILETERESHQRLSQQPEPADKQLSPSKGKKEPVYLSAADSHLNLQAVTGSHHRPRNSVSCLPPLTVSWVELMEQITTAAITVITLTSCSSRATSSSLWFSGPEEEV